MITSVSARLSFLGTILTTTWNDVELLVHHHTDVGYHYLKYGKFSFLLDYLKVNYGYQ